MKEISIALLKEIPIFSDLNEEEIKEIFNISSIKKFEKNDVVLLQHEPGDSLFILLQGKVKVVLFSKDGKEVILSTLSRGDYFGEMSLLDGKPRSASVIASEDSEFIILKREKFIKLIKNYPNIALKLLSEFSRRLRTADKKISSLALMDVYGRVARAIMELAEKDGIKEGNNYIIERPTHQNLANMAGTSRETVSRVLRDFIQSGYISIEGKNLIIHDLELNK